jgi:succinoglycan biosynthesis transport protein ExoP
MQYQRFPVQRRHTSPPHQRAVTVQPDCDRSAVSADDLVYQSDGLVIGEYWSRVRRHFWTLLAITTLGVIIGVAYSYWQVPTFRATATIEVQGMNDNLLNMKELTPVAQWSSANDDIQSQIRLLQSRKFIERVVSRVSVGTPEHPGGGAAGAVSSDTSAAPGGQRHVSASKTAVDRASRNLSVRGVGRTRMIEISYASTDPERAAQFVNALTDEFIAYNVEMRGRMNGQTREWIDGQVEELRKKLRTSEDALREYAQRSALVILDEKNSVSEDKLRQQSTRHRSRSLICSRTTYSGITNPNSQP